MLEKTFLTGKADFLESSIAKMQNRLADYGFTLNASPVNHPVPYIYSLHVSDSQCPALFSNGKGISEKAATASALGEFIERLGTHYLFADYCLNQSPKGFLIDPQETVIPTDVFNKQQVLSENLWQFYDPEQQVDASHLVTLQGHHHAVVSIPMQNWKTNETAYFPMNLLNTLYASNGLAAGNTFEEAAVQGVSEIFERSVRLSIIRNNWCLPEMPKESWQQLTTVNEAMTALAAQGIRLDIRDASLGGKFPVIAIILHDEIDGRCFVSFGAHPIAEVAIERTLTESLQGRDLAQRDGFAYPSTDDDFVQSEENGEAHFIDASGVWHLRFFSSQPDFSPVAWDFNGDINAQWQAMVNIIDQNGYALYVHTHQQLALHVVRLVVPGMSEIYPVTDLLDGNANRGLPLLNACQQINWQKDSHIEQLLDCCEEEGYDAHSRVASLIGLLADPGTPWQWLTISELKLGCLLYLGDFEAAQQALAEVFALGKSFPAYHALEMALSLLMSDQLEAHAETLEKLFGEECWGDVVQWIDGESFLWDIELSNSFQYSARHQSLLSAHSRLHDALAS